MIKELTNQHILDILHNGYAFVNERITEDFRKEGRILIKDRTIIEAVTQSLSSNGQTGLLIFDNCIFTENVSFNDINFSSFTFKNNCLFKKNLKLSTRANDVHIENTIVEGTCELHCMNIQQLKINSLRVNGEASFTGYAKSTAVHTLYSATKIEFEGFASQSCSLDDINCNKLIFKNNAMTDLVFKDSRCGYILFDTYTISGKLVSSDLKKANKISFINNSFAKEIEFTNNEVGELIYEMHKPLDLFIKEGTINKFELDVKQQLMLRLLEANFGILRFIGAPDESSSINIQNGTYKEISFKSFINKGHVVIANVELTKEQTLEICASDMGKTDFIKCNFKKAKFAFENSKVSEIFLSQTDFGKKVLLNGKESFAQAQLAFGQLTTAFQKQGDNVRAAEYQAREVEAHYKNIDLLSWKWPQINLTKVALWLNKWSNNFGRQWGRALLFTFGLGIMIFYALIISTEEYIIGWGWDWQPFLPAFLRFMNPIRFIDTEQVYQKLGITLNNWSYFWDLFGRVVAAYGFYQLIAAFRKYGKKSS